MIKTFTIVHDKKLDIKGFLKSPVILDNHRWDRIIGKAKDISVVKKKDNLFSAKIKIYIKDKNFIEYSKKEGVKIGVTIGYIKHEKKDNDLFSNDELVEISLVNINSKNQLEGIE